MIIKGSSGIVNLNLVWLTIGGGLKGQNQAGYKLFPDSTYDLLFALIRSHYGTLKIPKTGNSET
jgi:hypothetical protein